MPKRRVQKCLRVTCTWIYGNIMECIWTDKSYYNKGFLFLGLNEPDIDDLLKVAKSRQITAYGTGIFCYYIVSTHTMYIHVYLQ